jgi:serine protease DegQ
MTPSIDWSEVVAQHQQSVVRIESGGLRFSGFAIEPNLIVTIARGLSSRGVQVGLESAQAQATIVGVDAKSDLAFLSVDGLNLRPVEFITAVPKVGSPCLRLGRPGDTLRATSGIVSVVSNKRWHTPKGADLEAWIESDAPMPGGFSGGPLLLGAGQVAGLQTRGAWRGQAAVIPASNIIASLARARTPQRRSWLGLESRPVRLPKDLASLTNEELGLLVTDVAEDGPAKAAGIQYGDTVLNVGSDDVKSLEDLYAYLQQDHVGQTVPVRILRGAEVKELQVTLQERPKTGGQRNVGRDA